MCGIAGLIDLTGSRSPQQMRDLAARMADCQAHRGPDQQGLWLSEDGRCALAHRRLSIIAPGPEGGQPMLAGDHALVFNGEFYGHVQARQKLEEQGIQFQTRTDSEVLLAGLRRHGPDFLTGLDAMYGLGLYEAKNRTLLLARDLFGEKPLYYTQGGGLFAFASEMQALTLLPDFDPAIRPQALAAYLALQYVPAPDSFYAHIRKVPPGSLLILDAHGDIRIHAHGSFRPGNGKRAGRSVADLADELEALLCESLRTRLISDVPLGAFLSGGVDSSLVAALTCRKLGRDLQSFSIGFENSPESEHLEARAMAETIGTRHRDRLLQTDVLEGAAQIGRHLDEPNGDSSCLPTWHLAEFARQSVTVALSGDGGDELFLGYGRYHDTLAEAAEAPSDWQAGPAYLGPRIQLFTDGETALLLDGMPAATAGLLADWRGQITRNRAQLPHFLRRFDAETYLPGAVLAKVDRMSMRHGLEVRAPLLAPAIAEFAASLAPDSLQDGKGQGKLVLKALAGRYLPMAWLTRRKRGFGLPMQAWGGDKLLPALRDVARDPQSRLCQFLSPSGLTAFLDGQAGAPSTYRLWALLVLEHWLQAHPAQRMG